MITVTNLRKIFTEQGVKGASSWKREDFNSTIIAAEFAAYEEAVERRIAAEDAAHNAQVEAANAAPKKGICEDCGRRVGNSGHSTLCTPCWDYAGWENTHSDAGHEQLRDSNDDADLTAEIADCQVCHPELDARTAKKSGRSRAGMVIIAKGTEIHKSNTFKVAAEAAGWTVSILGTVNIAEDGEEEERFVATATKGDDRIELAWNGRAYDYPSSSATLGGKGRKVRNLKEALRIL